MNKIKYDDYFNNGQFEIFRIGKLVSCKNLMTQKDKEEMEVNLYNDYDKKKQEIDDRIVEIRNKVLQCNPLDLLLFISSMNFMTHFFKFSEIEYTAEEAIQNRALEYVQSILVSSPNIYKNRGQENIEKERLMNDILLNIEDLHNLIQNFYFYWYAHIKKEQPELDEKIIDYIYESQMLYLVRGKRYQIYEIPHLRELLNSQKELFEEIFSIDVNLFLQGMEKLQYSLSNRKVDSMNAMREELDKFKSFEEIDNIEKLELNMEDLLGFSTYDVERVTNWPKKFIKTFSYTINECSYFYDETNKFKGWPIIDLPIQKKPFIEINDKFYCFDYYSLFDNIYRVIQKIITSSGENAVNSWQHNQKESSEEIVKNIFQKLLPECIVYTDNHYPKEKSLKQMIENDLIIIYDNNLFIIEVKAGSFTYTPPIYDYKSHIQSFKTLLEKANDQCENTLKYINSNDEVIIYNSDKTEKFKIKKNSYENIYTFCVTIDNFNEFEARAEKLNFIKFNNNAIAVSVDDLRVYNDYFEDSLYFLHFLKQRKIATSIATISLSDELDHLGMYIKYNMYSIEASTFDENSKINWYGFRSDIDNYFSRLNIPELQSEKPIQMIPDTLKNIISFLSKYKLNNRTILSNFLLDLCTESKNEFCDTINKLLKCQKQTGRMKIATTSGEVRYCLFVYQENVEKISDNDVTKYCFSSMLIANDIDTLNISLYFDENDMLIDVKFKLLKRNEVPIGKEEEFIEYTKKLVESRFLNYKKKTGEEKIGRNELCPCGSGKKYKRCCGN